MAVWIGVFAGILLIGLISLFGLISNDSTAVALEVEQLVFTPELGKGRRSIPLKFVGNPGRGEMKLYLQEVVFQEYAKSSSMLINGYFQATGAELDRLQLRLELLDKNGKRIYADRLEPVKKFEDPIRSQDLIPLHFFEHIKKKGVYPHSALLSITAIEWKQMEAPYTEASPKRVFKEGGAEGRLMEFFERSSVYNPHPKDKYVFHQLSLLLDNPEGEKPIKELKLRVKWVGENREKLLEKTYSIINEDSPQLFAGQQLPINISEKIKKAKQPSDIKSYQLTVEEVK